MPDLNEKHFSGESDITTEKARELTTKGNIKAVNETLTKLGWEGQPIGDRHSESQDFHRWQKSRGRTVQPASTSLPFTLLPSLSFPSSPLYLYPSPPLYFPFSPSSLCPLSSFPPLSLASPTSFAKNIKKIVGGQVKQIKDGNIPRVHSKQKGKCGHATTTTTAAAAALLQIFRGYSDLSVIMKTSVAEPEPPRAGVAPTSTTAQAPPIIENLTKLVNF